MTQVFHKKAQKVHKLLDNVLKLEKVGKYESAFELLSTIWSDTAELPDVNDLLPSLKAEIFLRCGAIIGYLGNIRQIPAAQETSKNLLSQARIEFSKQMKTEKIAECETLLASAYYRSGEYEEAAVWVEESLSHKLPPTNEIRLLSYIVKSVILLAESKYEETIDYLQSVRNHFDASNDLAKGCFCSNLSLAYKNRGLLIESLRYLNFARSSHQKSGHLSYLATVENNLAQVYLLNDDLPKALECADNALKLFEELGDKARKAFVIDTKAQIYIKKKEFETAVKLTDKAVSILLIGDNAGMLQDVYLTKAKALVQMENIAAATIAISHCIQLGNFTGNTNKIAEIFELTIRSQFPVITKKIYSERKKHLDNLSLKLPPEIPANQDFIGVWVQNSEFERIGLKKGNLAVVVVGEVLPNDFVAVLEKETTLVSFGFYENQFGIICLENYARDVEVLSENEVNILGKVVGFASPETDFNNRYDVKSIVLQKSSNDGYDYCG